MLEDLAKEALHPCQNCGACCAFFRVAFYWIEAEPTTVPFVPIEFTEDLDLQQRCMKGTDHKHKPKCIALEGTIGKLVRCQIYDSRPSPCRKFTASFENGIKESRCDEARKKHGLPALNKNDWKSYLQKQPLGPKSSETEAPQHESP